MKTKVLKLCSLLMALLVMTAVLAACGNSEDNESAGDDSQQEVSDSEDEDFEDDLYEEELYEDESADLDFWLGEYSGDSGTLTIDYADGMLYYGIGVSTDDGFSSASGTLTEVSGDPYMLEASDFVFSYDDSDDSIEVSLQDGVSDMDHYTGWYFYVGPVASAASPEDDPRLDVAEPASIEEWYGEYEGEAGTLTITDSLEDMVDYDVVSNDGSWMSGTWTKSDVGLGVMESSEFYVIYHVEDGSVEITGKTEADNENNASYIGVYYPVG